MFYDSQDSFLNAILNHCFLILDTRFQRNRELQHTVNLVLNGTENLKRVLETFSIRFFKVNCKLQTAKCHVTTALQSRLQFAAHF